MSERLIVFLIVFLIVAGIAMVIVGSVIEGNNFKRACEAADGVAAWDGRQYQCIKVSPSHEPKATGSAS